MVNGYVGPWALKTKPKAVSNCIIMEMDPTIKGAEGYYLSVTPERVMLASRTAAGMFYAIQTLRQLLPAALENDHGQSLEVPCVEIEDEPAYPYRGMMLDVSRHFFSVAYVKKYIDMMALYKMNKLHLHLTDDQGWRIEIKKYPLLTQRSAWRSFNDQDSACMKLAVETGNPDFQIDPAHIRGGQYGGFYTQEQMKDIIRYAALRHIEIIPEIDMPGHMMAAILQYPWLTCEPLASGKRDGFSVPICPCKDTVFQFAMSVFGEIASLFSSKYIHIGGDEVEKSDWKKSPLVQRFMAQQHIPTEDSLQSFFTGYMQHFFMSRGKTLVGWDEIVQGGIDSNAVVMFWRPWAKDAPRKATANGNKVIMSPDGPFYFDAWPSRNSLGEVYHYNPVDAAYGMSPDQSQNIIGVQANLWTERVPTEARADYLIMPRLTAIAELGWTHKDLFDSYLVRLNQQYERLDRLHINYRLPDLPQIAENRVFIDTTSFMVASPSSKLTLHYTTDGSWPNAHSPQLTQPISIVKSCKVNIAAFTASGRRGDIQTISFDRQSYAVGVSVPSVQPGLAVNLYRGEFPLTTKMSGKGDSSMVLTSVGIPSGMPDTGFGLQFRGFIQVPETGIYSFFLTSDDGSTLRIGDRLVVDNDGYHSAREKSGQVALQKGVHPFLLDYMDGGGGNALHLTYSFNNSSPQVVPSDWFVR
jgi:hexosaminidase